MNLKLLPARKMARIFEAPEHAISRARGIAGFLSKMFITICSDLNVGTMRWQRLINDYVNDPENGVPDNPHSKTSERGNLTKQLSKPEMSWKTFCKALRIFKFTRVEITLVAHHRNGSITTHHSSVILRGPDADRPLQQFGQPPQEDPDEE